MTYLSKEEIFSADDRETRDVEVPEWGGVVRVRALSGTDRDAYDASMVAMSEDNRLTPDMANMKVKLVAAAIVTEDGELMFTPLDVGRLGQKSAAALNRVYEVATKISGMDNQAITLAMGNSNGAQSAASISS